MTSVFTRPAPRSVPRETDPRTVNNRRAASRYAVKIPLHYRAPETTLPSGWKQGQTLDMSARGMLIDIPETVTVGTMLELAMDWTGLYHAKTAVRLFLTGPVVRVDQRGTAVRIASHQFRDVTRAVVRPRRAERNLAVA